ncbi:MAG: DNA repair protein RadA [Clostridia bacterium]|nr:DNA repair protein RadA [Clostridia bacterium]
MAVKSVYICSECEYKSPKWLGKCPSCGSWNSMQEEALDEGKGKEGKSTRRSVSTGLRAVKVGEISVPEYMRSVTGYGELDRVLGGGIVEGSVILLSGEPGIGKSTILMQASAAVGETKNVLYVSGEESLGQLKLRAQRLNVQSENLYFYTETDVERIMSECDSIKPQILIVDSVQTLFSDKLNSAPGSIAQVRECAMSFISKAKNEGISVILVGHVTKDGGISGPKILEHMVDAVLYFEGERSQQYRIIRAIKNRYGSTNEIGVFEMTDKGLCEVENPSKTLMSDRPLGVSGSCAVCVMEGTRPLIAEIQALVTPTVFAAPRRNSNGIDYNRLNLLLAVLEKRLGMKFSQNDVYINVTGGLRLDEPAADLALCMALISSISDRPINDKTVVFGEIGLSGECRMVSYAEQRVSEAGRLGFETVIIPQRNNVGMSNKNIKVKAAAGIYDVLAFLETAKKDV